MSSNDISQGAKDETPKTQRARKGRAATLEAARSFRLPANEDIAKMATELHLTTAQAHDFQIQLRHIDEDLKGFVRAFGGRQARSDLVRRLNRLAKILFALEDELRRGRDTMTHFLPFDTLEAIGQMMSFSAMEAALGRKIPSPNVVGEVAIAAAEEAPLRVAAIEGRFDYQRQSFGLNRGDEILTYFVRCINQPISTWLELERLNAGGRPANAIRDFLIIRLAQAAPDILGGRATGTAGGKFVTLCNAVFIASGVETEGLEKAVERILNKRSARSKAKAAKRSSSESANRKVEP